MSVAKEIAMLDISGSLDEDGRCMGDILRHFSWIKKLLRLFEMVSYH